MTNITAQQVKELRDRTAAGMMDAKQALVEAGGDIEKAIDVLRKKGLAKASKKAGRDTAEGVVHSYIHAGGKIGVLLEVNCESDFVALTEQFQQMVHDIAMHIAAVGPQYVSSEDIPADVIAKEKEINVEEAKGQNKPADVAERIAEGKLKNFYEQVSLLNQPYVRDGSRTVGEIIAAMISTLGENIRINRFARFQIGA